VSTAPFINYERYMQSSSAPDHWRYI